MDINWDEIDDSIEELSFKDKIKYGKVVSVYDGYRVKIVFLLESRLYKWDCLLDRMNTHELITKNNLDKQYVDDIKDKLKDRILNKIVKVKCDEFDKNGRLLIELYINNTESINQWLIDSKMH